MEMMNLLGLPDPAPTVARMAQLGVLAVVLPEASPETLAQLVAQEKARAWRPMPCAGLRPYCPRMCLWPNRLPLVSAFRARRKSGWLLRPRVMGKWVMRALAYQLGMDGAMDRVLLCNGTIRDLRDWTIPVFP
jgi:poly(A) polymerase